MIMKQFMFFSFQEAFIEGHYHRVLITFFNHRYIICTINAFLAGCFSTVTCQTRLTATHDTASAACHDLYQMVILLTALYLFHDFSCIGKTADYTDI